MSMLTRDKLDPRGLADQEPSGVTQRASSVFKLVDDKVILDNWRMAVASQAVYVLLKDAASEGHSDHNPWTGLWPEVL